MLQFDSERFASAALESGATQLGEDGPDGRHWIFSERELGVFVQLVREERGREWPALPY